MLQRVDDFDSKHSNTGCVVSFLIREHIPGCCDISRPRREELVGSKSDALNIYWLKDLPEVRVEESFVMSTERKGVNAKHHVEALILTEDGNQYAHGDL